MLQQNDNFGALLLTARSAAGVSRRQLAKQVGLDLSHIYRLETGGRRPSRDVVLVLADALKLHEEAVSRWLERAGYAPLPLLSALRVMVRGGGTQRSRGRQRASTKLLDNAAWAKRLEAVGFEEPVVRRLCAAVENAEISVQQQTAATISTALLRVAETIESPVRIAVLPAAGWQHRVLAPWIMQRLLLLAIREATDSGLARVILVLPPGAIESIYEPINEALKASVVPAVDLRYAEQFKPDGLGEAVLRAEGHVGTQPFAVLLPDDIVHAGKDRDGRSELRRMLDSSKKLPGAHFVALTSVPRHKMPTCGVARSSSEALVPGVFPVLELVEKPDVTNRICTQQSVAGIVGRYLLQPSIFNSLKLLAEQTRRPLELTDALELLRCKGGTLCAYELKAERTDLGGLMAGTSQLLNDLYRRKVRVGR